MKLKAKEIKPTRDQMLIDQGGLCGVCKLPIEAGKDVLDHCHTHGHVRGVLHSGCNMLLGKLENNHRRYKVNLKEFVQGVMQYIETQPDVILIHPTHKTAEEHKALAAKRRKAKAKAKTK